MIDCLVIFSLNCTSSRLSSLPLIAKQYDAFLASSQLLKQLPRILGPGLNKAGKFPAPVTHEEKLDQKVDEVKATIKFQMKKVLTLGVAIGHVELTNDEIVRNAIQAVSFLVSLLKKVCFPFVVMSLPFLGYISFLLCFWNLLQSKTLI